MIIFQNLECVTNIFGGIPVTTKPGVSAIKRISHNVVIKMNITLSSTFIDYEIHEY